MRLNTNAKDLENDLNDLLNLFGCENDQTSISHKEKLGNNEVENSFLLQRDGVSKQFSYKNSLSDNLTDMKKKSLRKRFAKRNLYSVLSETLDKKLPWGSLTGIRPTKLARDIIENGETKEYTIGEFFQREFYVSERKSQLLAKILKNQKGIIRNDNLVDIYLNIPICPSRCLYCSFISSEICRVKHRVEEYIDCMIKELNAVKEIISQKAYIVRNIYMGGGTPSVLEPQQLDRLLKEVTFNCEEFTVECGRPETITREKLEVLKKNGVTRISINPQTFCDATLKRIGRNHKVSDVLEAYSMALEFDFVVNMDVIVGLPGEKRGHFKKTLQTLLDLAPDNITIHTLSVKKGSKLKEEGTQLSDKDLDKTLQEGEDILMQEGYKPYYMYRQKHQLGGLENVGFFRDSICMFNIDSMEETSTIIAVGANAMSKRVFNTQNRIERCDNVKFIEDYIRQIDEMIERKRKFFK